MVHINKILERIRQIEKEKQRISGFKTEHIDITFNEIDWYPSNKNVKLFPGGITFTGSSYQDYAYVSYKERNNSFNIAPKSKIINNLDLYDKLIIEFTGELENKSDVNLFIITYYNNEKKDTHMLSLNSKRSIPIDFDNIRIAIKIQGEGSFQVGKISIRAVTNAEYYKNDSISINDNKSKLNEKCIKDITVAIIADEFTYESFKYEFNAVYLSPNNWLQTIKETKPDIFFCESAWSGIDPDKREWRGKIYSSINFKKENRTELLEIIQYCKENGIPTIFWNKEDPTHFDDKVHNFVDTALKFDYIFTTSIECVERYKKEYKHKNVFPLMFAVQPKHFNPIETCERTDEFIFAGSYYKQHPERSKHMEYIFDLILKDNPDKLVIYDRHYYSQDPNHEYPEKYKKFIRPRLSYTQLDKGYKGSKYAINITTETNSKTMFARRVFELMASNTLVLSNYSKGLKEIFGDLIYLIDSNKVDYDDSVINKMLSVDYEKKRLKALRYVLNYHTYENRWEYILKTIGFIKIMKNSIPSICMIAFTKNEAEIERSINIFMKQSYSNKNLLIINQTENNPVESAKFSTLYGSDIIEIIDFNLLEKYGRKIEEFITANYVAFINFNSYYGNNYLSDMLLNYKYLDKDTIVVKDPEQKPYRFTNKGSLHASILPISLLKYIGYDDLVYNHEQIIEKLFERGVRVFNCDQFNYATSTQLKNINIAEINI